MVYFRSKNLTSVFSTVYFRSKNLTSVICRVFSWMSKYRPYNSVIGLYHLPIMAAVPNNEPRSGFLDQVTVKNFPWFLFRRVQNLPQFLSRFFQSVKKLTWFSLFSCFLDALAFLVLMIKTDWLIDSLTHSLTERLKIDSLVPPQFSQSRLRHQPVTRIRMSLKLEFHSNSTVNQIRLSIKFALYCTLHSAWGHWKCTSPSCPMA